MDSCFSSDHFARDHISTDITTCNTEEPEQKYCFGALSNRLLGGGVGGGLK